MAATAIIYELIARDSASATFARVGAAADTMGKQYGNVQNTIQKAALGITVAMAAGAAISIKMATDFQTSMTKIQTQAGGSAKDVAELSAQVLKLGTYAEQSPKELADALYHLKSVGLDNADAMKALATASDLAAVGGSDLEDTTNALAGAWRTGINGAQDFGQAAATVNAIIGAGNMRMEDLVAAMGTGFLASAKTFGLSLQSVGAALAVMTDEGVPADQAATRLRMSFSLLGAPSAEASKSLAKIGLTGLQLADAMRSPGGMVAAIGLLKDHLDASGLSASQSAQLLSNAFGGGRSSSAILTLVNNFDVLKQKQDQINGGIAKYGDSVQTQRQTVQAQMKLLVSSLQVAAVEIGEKLLPLANQVIHAFMDMFTWITNLSGPAKTTFGAIVMYLAIIGPALLLVPKLISAAKVAMAAWRLVVIAWTFATEGATAAQALFNAATEANPITLIIEGIILVIAALGVAIYELVTHWSAVWGAIKSAAEVVWHALAAVISVVWNGGIKPVFNAIVAAWNAVVNAFVVAGLAIGTAFVAVKNALVIAGQAIANAFVTVYNVAVKPVIDAIVVAFHAVADAATWLWQTILQPVFNFIAQAAIIMGKILLGIVLIPLVALWQFVIAPAALFLWHNVFEPMFNGIAAVTLWWWNNVTLPVVNAFIQFFTVIIPAAAMWLWHNVFEPVWNGIAAVVEFVWNNIVMPVFESYVIFFTQIIPAAAMWLWHNVFEPVWNGIGTAVSWVYHNILLPIWAGLQLDWQILEGAAMWLWHNVIQPVWDGIGAAISFAYHNVILPVFNAIKDAIHDVGAVFGAVKDGIVAVWGGIQDAVSVPIHFVVDHAINPLIGAWDSVVDFLHLGFLHINPIPPFATGGIAPGYTPGRDNQLVAVSGGEAIMRPEWTQAAGSSYVYAANAAAANGGIKGAQQFIAANGLPGMGGGVPGFFLGGIFDWVGNAADAVGEAIGSAWNGLLNIGGKVFDFVKDPIGGVTNLLNSMLGGTDFGPIKQFGSVLDMVTAWPKSMIGGLVQKITDWWNSTLGGGNFAQGGNAGGNIGQYQAYAASQLARFGWGQDQMGPLISLWNRESGWNPLIANKSSGAYGIPQSLPGSKMAAAGADWMTNAATQINWGEGYIAQRYGSPAAAWAHELAAGWYGNGLVGGIFNRPTLIGVGESGPERVDVTPLRGGTSGRLNGTSLVGGDLNVYVTSNNASADDILQETMFELRRVRRGGVYSK